MSTRKLAKERPRGDDRHQPEYDKKPSGQPEGWPLFNLSHAPGDVEMFSAAGATDQLAERR